MARVVLTRALCEEYERLFWTCRVAPDRRALVDTVAQRIAANQSRYLEATRGSRVPWHVAGLIHALECGLSFRGHLHNGDPLTARTVRVPKGRPRAGAPPFTWEESARDALEYAGLTACAAWTLPETLYRLEAYNGWGYRTRHPHVLSPYLWGCSNHYARGKYVADGAWSDTAVSRQAGAAVLLRRLADMGAVDLQAGAGI